MIGPIQQHVRDATGRELTIRGGAELKLSLEPKLVIDDVALGNAAWGASPQMLTAKRIEAQVALLPLLRRRVDVVRFALIEPTISLETDGKGNGNWQLGGAPGEGAGAARSPGGLAFGDLAISNGTMTYRDGGHWQGDQHHYRNAVASRARSAVADQRAIPRQGRRHRRVGRRAISDHSTRCCNAAGHIRSSCRVKSMGKRRR